MNRSEMLDRAAQEWQRLETTPLPVDAAGAQVHRMQRANLDLLMEQLVDMPHGDTRFWMPEGRPVEKSTSCAAYVEHDTPCCRAHANHGWFHVGPCCPGCEDCPGPRA